MHSGDLGRSRSVDRTAKPSNLTTAPTLDPAQATPPVVSDWSGLLTPENSAVVLIDHQQAIALAIRSRDHRVLAANAAALAKAAHAFSVPLIVTVLDDVAAGPLLIKTASSKRDQLVVRRSSRRNAWADPDFVVTVAATGRRKLIMAGLWTEVALSLTALSALEVGYEVYIVADASGGTSPEAHETALRRLIQAGAVPVTWLQVGREYLDAMNTAETRQAIRTIDEEHSAILHSLWIPDGNAAAPTNAGTSDAATRHR